jgi:hypothetical protein
MFKFIIRGAQPGTPGILMPENDQQGFFFYDMPVVQMNA